jgi:hypothetical protein
MPVPADTAAAVSDCLYLQNSALFGGGMVFYGQSGSNAWLALTNCQFILNDATSTGVASQGGALYIAGSIFMEGCSLSMNRATNGGGIYFGGDTTMRISNSRFDQNTATDHGGGLSFDIHRNLLLEVVQSVFWKNSATYGGGAISIITNNSGYADKTASLYVINSSFCTNSSASGGGILVQNNLATTRIENSILWACAPNDINIANYQSRCRVRTSCLPSASSYPAAGNINADPKFVNAAAGDLRLGTGSPCIDAGNNYVDYFPTVPGFQLLPATDIDGFWRVVDGNGDGTPTVDMGAHERQGT